MEPQSGVTRKVGKVATLAGSHGGGYAGETPGALPTVDRFFGEQTEPATR